MWARVVLVPVAVIGAVLSYQSLYKAALPTFGPYLAAGFPLLVDLLILGASLQYVAGAKIGRPMTGWRLTAHCGVAGTLVLNALAARELGEVPWHVTAPAVWAVLVELTGKQVLGQWKAVHHGPAASIAPSLWLSAPVESVRTRLLMARTGVADAHQARIGVGTAAAAREALNLSLPRRVSPRKDAKRVRRVVNRQLRAGSLPPSAVLDAVGWTNPEKLPDRSPESILRAVVQTILRGPGHHEMEDDPHTAAVGSRTVRGEDESAKGMTRGRSARPGDRSDESSDESSGPGGFSGAGRGVAGEYAGSNEGPSNAMVPGAATPPDGNAVPAWAEQGEYPGQLVPGPGGHAGTVVAGPAGQVERYGRTESRPGEYVESNGYAGSVVVPPRGEFRDRSGLEPGERGGRRTAAVGAQPAGAVHAGTAHAGTAQPAASGESSSAGQVVQEHSPRVPEPQFGQQTQFARGARFAYEPQRTAQFAQASQQSSPQTAPGSPYAAGRADRVHVGGTGAPTENAEAPGSAWPASDQGVDENGGAPTRPVPGAVARGSFRPASYTVDGTAVPVSSYTPGSAPTQRSSRPATAEGDIRADIRADEGTRPVPEPGQRPSWPAAEEPPVVREPRPAPKPSQRPSWLVSDGEAADYDYDAIGDQAPDYEAMGDEVPDYEAPDLPVSRATQETQRVHQSASTHRDPTPATTQSHTIILPDAYGAEGEDEDLSPTAPTRVRKGRMTLQQQEERLAAAIRIVRDQPDVTGGQLCIELAKLGWDTSSRTASRILVEAREAPALRAVQ
nr:DUF2637 domain-containing protein [Kineosporia mesophila]